MSVNLSSSSPSFLHVCLVSDELPPVVGGIGSYVQSLARGLAELGHRIDIVTRGWGEDGVAEADGVRVHRVSIPEPRWRRGTRRLTLRFFESREILLWNVRVSRTIGRIARADPIDLIECPEYRSQAFLASFSHRDIPLVARLHTPSLLCRLANGVGAGGSLADTLITEYLERRMANRALALTSPSRALADEVANRWRLEPSGISIIPNPIDAELFQPSENIVRDEATLLFVGRIERRKGVEALVSSLPAIVERFPDTRLRLVGNVLRAAPTGPSMKHHLLRLLADAGLTQETVEFSGPLPREELPSIYGAAAICVIPSLYENFPYTCLEAMASGCAVIASAVGGVPEIVTDGVDGLLVPPGDHEALAQAVIRLRQDAGVRRRLGLQARQTVRRRFSQLAVAEQTARFYGTLLDAGRRGSARLEGERQALTAMGQDGERGGRS